MALTALLVGTSVVEASAAGPYRTLANANVRAGASTSTLLLMTLLKGTTVTIDCYVMGQTVNGTAIWDHLTTGGYVSDSLILTGSNAPVVPRCGAYNRGAAASWALNHINDAPRYSQDCTWFVSQALWAGGMKKTSSWNTTTYGIFHPTLDAVNADHLKNYLVTESRQATITQLSPTQRTVPGAQVGDLIMYDWDRNGVVDHAMIITSISGQYPTVTGHTSPVTQGWDYSKSSGKPIYQVYPRVSIYLIHLTV